MNKQISDFLKKFTPFLLIGIMLTISVALFFLLFYVFLWGLLVAAVIYAIVYIKDKFFTSKKIPTKGKGRIIEHDEIK